MLEDDLDQTANIVPLFPARETKLASATESLRLIRAFLAVSDPAQRLRIVEWVERLADADRSPP